MAGNMMDDYCTLCWEIEWVRHRPDGSSFDALWK